MSAPSPIYQFGPLERRGLVAGVTGGQAGALFGGLAVAVLAIRARPSVGGVAVAVLAMGAATAAAFVQHGGWTALDWLPVLYRWAARRVAGAHRFRHPGRPLPVRKPATARNQISDVPEQLRGYHVGAARMPGREQPVGVVHDVRTGTFTAVLAVRGRSLELASTEDKVARLEAWGALLAGLGRAASPVHRLQWIERTVAEDGDAMTRHLHERARLPADHPAHHAYRDLIGRCGAAAQPHETYLAVSVSAARARRAVKAAGGGPVGAVQVLLRELGALERDLRTAGITVDGPLPLRAVTTVVLDAYDPAGRRHRARQTGGDAAIPLAGPMAADEHWHAYRTDSGWHATYWIAQWPRLPVGPDFLAHLLLGTTATRSVALTMEPVPAARAHREVQHALVQGMADDELRARAGFLSTARRRGERDAVARREEELAAGHADYRITGYVTVTGADADALELACGEVEQAAERSRLELRRLYGQQADAFALTLPLTRGLR